MADVILTSSLGAATQVYADKGYDTSERRAMLSARGIADGVMRPRAGRAGR